MKTEQLNESHVDSFQKVYREAKELYGDQAHSPHDPVIAFEDREQYGGLMWRLQSRLHCDEGTLACCDLDAFHEFFWSSYSDPAYQPDVEDMKDFAEVLMS